MKFMLIFLFITLTACADHSSVPLPLMIGDTLIVDHLIIVPPEGILFANGSKIGGVQ